MVERRHNVGVFFHFGPDTLDAVHCFRHFADPAFNAIVNKNLGRVGCEGAIDRNGSVGVHTPQAMSASELRYNRERYMPRRRELAQRWADLIMDGALPTSQVVESPRCKRRN